MASASDGVDAPKGELRHIGPQTLLLKGVPCVIWAEDALHHYGVPTVVFDMFCLVEDEISAAQKLEETGFSRLPEDPVYSYHLPELVTGRPRLYLVRDSLTKENSQRTRQ
jgi:hypothetical protein